MPLKGPFPRAEPYSRILNIMNTLAPAAGAADCPIAAEMKARGGALLEVLHAIQANLRCVPRRADR